MTHLVAELWSPVWQKRKRTSFNPLAKAYLPDMMAALSTDLPVGNWWLNWSSSSSSSSSTLAETIAEAGFLDVSW
jgi:hypothetical protein